MSDDPKHGATTIHASKDSGGNAGKWLLGALAAVVVAGGGYYVWQNSSTAPASTQTAYNDQYASEPVQAGPLPSDQSASISNSASENVAASPSSSDTRSTTRTRRAAAPAAVPEETIGITPVNAVVEDPNSEEVIVTAPARPVWARAPSAQRLSALYPEHARSVGREGEASLQCTVLGDGALNCARVSEFPEHAGFGAAAMRVANALRHAPQTASGRDAAGTPVNLHVVFRMEDQPSRG